MMEETEVNETTERDATPEHKFDVELADRLAKKQFENIELRIRLAESEATRRLLLMLFLMVLSFILVRATVPLPE